MKLVLRVVCGLFLLTGTAHAAECPPNVDPVYCKTAEATGGKVVTDLKDLKDIPEVKPPPEPSQAAEVHNSIYSTNLGCDQQAEADQPLCRIIENEQEWSMAGHGGMFPGWRVTYKSVCRTYYRADVSQETLPQLQRMLKVNRFNMDWRLELGLTSLVRILTNQNGSTPEDAASIFNRENPDYILKGNCRN